MTISAGPPLTRPDRRWVVRLAAPVVGLALVLHVPGFVRPLFNSDESSLATMAMEIQHGGALYHETADRKPPVVPYLYALVFTTTGERDIRPVRVIAALALAATALLLALEAKRRTGRVDAGIGAALFLLAGTAANFPADSQAAGFEVFMLLPMTGAVLAAARGRPAAAGLLLAAACLCKQTAVVTGLPVALLLFRAGRWSYVARAGAAALATVLATAVVFGPREFLLWTVTGNGGYLSMRGSLYEPFLRGLGMTVAFAGFNAVMIWFAYRAAKRGTVDRDLWLWLGGGIVAVLAGFRFFGHYYLQLVPPLALIAAHALPRWADFPRRAVAGLVVPVAAMWIFSFAPPNARGIIPYREIADTTRALTSPSERVFVWGEYPEIYWAAEREPATRFIHTGFLTGNSGGRDARRVRSSDGLPGAWDLLAEDFATSPPDLIVDTSGTSIRNARFHPIDASPLWPEVVDHYRVVHTVDGVTFYRRIA